MNNQIFKATDISSKHAKLTVHDMHYPSYARNTKEFGFQPSQSFNFDQASL
jgi:hypothetical protein